MMEDIISVWTDLDLWRYLWIEPVPDISTQISLRVPAGSHVSQRGENPAAGRCNL